MFSQVCVKNYVHMVGIWLSACWNTHLPVQTPHTPLAVTAVDSTHPTGMHFCMILDFLYFMICLSIATLSDLRIRN